MTRPVRFAPEATTNLADIYDYIAPRGGERVAATYVARIYQYCLDMGTFPERGMRRDDIWPGLRLVGFERRATIAFQVTPDEVWIVGVFGRGQDVEGELRK